MKSTPQESLGKSRGAAWLLLWLSLLCCVFEGALRKWAVGDTSIAGRIAYLSKDMVLAAFLLMGAGRASALTTIAQPYLRIGIGLLAFGAITSAVFGIDPVGAVLTILTFFILPLSCWAAGRHLPGDSLRRFALWVAILSLPMAPLCVRQFYSPSDSAINRYSTEEEKIAISTSGMSERVRATGTFSYISGLGEFAPVAVWAGIVTFTLARRRRERWLGYAAMAAGACCAFVTVSRFVVLVSVGLVMVWAVVGGQFGRKAGVALTVGIMALAALTLTGQWDAAEEITSTVYLRHAIVTKNVNTGGDSFGHRFWYGYIHPLEAILIAPLGDGLGSEQPGSTIFAAKGRQPWTFESPFGRTIIELGVPGLLGFLVTLGIVFAPLKAEYRKNEQGAQRTVLAVTAAVLFSKAVVGFQFNHVAAYFFWAIGATVLALEIGIQPPHRLARPVRIGRLNP